MDEKESSIFVVKSLPRGAVLEDGQLLEIEVHGEGEAALRLRFSPQMLDIFLTRAGDLWARAMTKEMKDTGRLQVRAREVEAVSAAAPHGGGKVLLAIKPKGAAATHYAIEPELAASLRPQLRKAEEAARQGIATPPA
jgi:Holliday junction resolvase